MLYIFDADATLRRCTVPNQPCPNKPGEWEFLPGVKEKLATIDWSRNGFGIASNQAGVALGYLSEATAYQMLCDLTVALLERWPPTGSLQICPHAPDAGCGCRKPHGVMLTRIMHAYAAGPGNTLYVGDLPSDEDAARAAGVSFRWAWEFFDSSKDAWTVMLAHAHERDQRRARGEV